MANQVVIDVAPSSVGSPMSSAAPDSRDIAASRQVLARWTEVTSSRTSAPVERHGSSPARSSETEESCSTSTVTTSGVD
ncbi:hypothetical protein C6I20_00450 [Aeromicrobium sp. A1-2]|nr:hypothetical protein C6I20_00450 [Aeromicrobium sp. A1-2]